MPNAQTRRHARNRRAESPGRRYQGTAANVIDAVAEDAETLTLTFDVSVQMSGIPQYPVDDTMPIAAELVDCKQCVLTYPNGTLTSQTEAIIPQAEPAIRSRTGGYARPGKVTFPSPA